MDWEAWNREQAKRIADYERAVLEVYKRAISSVSAMYASFPDIDPDKPFSFDDYPEVRERARKVFRKMHDDIDKVIINGVEAQWTLANNRNNELSNIVFGGLELSPSMRRRYYADNSAALGAFKKRKSAGLGISDRVWKYTRQYKSEIEAALWVGIGNGVSAQEMSRMLRDYLQYPDKLFRRVRDEFGELRLSKAAKEFNPGRGVYRSSYKNARRLAATETNMAYRTADFLRWQQMDYVVGIEIRLSNNHTLNGRPFKDICDELAGFYPKSFKFTGWHPLCRCYQVPVLKTDKELAEDALRIAHGREPSVTSNNEVKDIPPQFRKWLEKNNGRISHAKSLPYFLRDNPVLINWKTGRDVALLIKESNIYNDKLLRAARPSRICLTEDQKAHRKELQKKAIAKFRGKTVHNVFDINITTNGIKEFLNQPHECYFEKNEAILTIDELLRSAKYLGVNPFYIKEGVRRSHIYETNLGGVKSWLVIREYTDGTISLYGVSDNPSISEKLIKP